MKCFAMTMGLTAAMGAATAASGAIVYVDAGVGTVEWNNAGTWDGSGAWQLAGNTAPSNDDLWGERTTGPATNAAGSNVYQSGHAGEDAPSLRMVVTGLDATATYQFYVYNVNAGGAAIVQGAVSADTSAGAGLPGLSDLTGGIEVLSDGTPGSSPSGDTRHQQTIVGTVTGSTSYAVYLDDYNPTGPAGDRATLDGIGYEIVPEPGSLALLGLGGLALLRRRRA